MSKPKTKQDATAPKPIDPAKEDAKKEFNPDKFMVENKCIQGFMFGNIVKEEQPPVVEKSAEQKSSPEKKKKEQKIQSKQPWMVRQYKEKHTFSLWAKPFEE